MLAEGSRGRATPLVGRESDLQRLRQGIDAARAGRADSIVLMGEGGIGKSRLLDAAAAAARDVDVVVLQGRAPITGPVPYGLIGDALRSWLRVNPVRTSLVPFDRGLSLVMPEWSAAATRGALEPGHARLLAAEGVIRLLQFIRTDHGPMALLADDLHAADPETVEVLRYVAAARIDGVCLIGAARRGEASAADELVTVLRRERLADVVEVGPLDERCVGVMVEGLLAAHPPSPLVADVLARTDGVPLLVEELVRGHVSAGTVSVSGGRATWQGGAAKVPGSVRELVSVRLVRLAEADQVVLVAGAVLGDFDPGLIRALSRQDDATISAALAAGRSCGLLEMADGSTSYRHGLLRDAVLDIAVPHLVDTMHRRAADCLGRTARNGTDHDRRARHLAALGADDAAAAAYTAAADAWLHEHALLAADGAARAAFETAVETPTHRAAADVLVRVLAAQGRWTEALEIDEDTVRHHGDSPERRYRRASYALDAGRPDLAEHILAAAVQAGHDSPELSLVAGRAAMVRGDAAAALNFAALAVAARDLGVRLASLELQGTAYDYLGDRDAARSVWALQAREAAAASQTQSELRATIRLATLELLDGEPPRRLREAVALAEQAGALVELAWAEQNLSIALAVQVTSQ